MTTPSLSSKTALITGAAGGLGKSLARAFLLAGANVLICDVNAFMLQTTSTELSALGHGSGALHAIPADITSEETCSMLVREAVSRFGRLDVLVNNAGIMDRFDPVADLEKAVWDRVVAVNLTAPYLLSKYAVGEFLREDREGGGKTGGTILNVGSIAGLRGGVAGAAYTASKHGLIGLTKNTAAMYAKRGVRCNMILPGGMDTNIASSFKDGMNMEAFMSVKGVMDLRPENVGTEDLAGLAVFLCGEGGACVNGTTVTADNGWMAA